MDDLVLKLEGICKSFAAVQVLKEVSLSLYAGQVHCLIGENGAGKSTLIKVVSGAYHPDAGIITYLGKTIGEIQPRWARENGINTIYQEIDLVPHLTAAENILLGEEPLTRFGNIDKKRAHGRCKELFAKLGVEIPLEVPVSQLRLAQQQMVAIAKALHMNSRVIIFDEPTSVFTSKDVEILFRIIRDLKKSNIAILYISHHMDEIFEIGDQITVLRDGALIRTDKTENFTKESLVHAMVGRNIDFVHDGAENEQGEIVLEVKNLCANKMVKDVSFQLHKNEILGFGGLVGAGRTETMRALMGVDPYESGEVLVRGQKARIKNPRHALGLGIGMLPESRKTEGIVGARPVGDNITYSYVENTTKLGIVRWKDVKAKAAGTVNQMAVRPNDTRKLVTFLSGGNQQKVVLGKLLAANCDILILDEPTRGVDVGARSEIYDTIKQLRAQGKAIIMISSDMTELLTQSDRILVMSEGQIVSEMKGAEATEEKVLSSALRVEA